MLVCRSALHSCTRVADRPTTSTIVHNALKYAVRRSTRHSFHQVVVTACRQELWHIAWHAVHEVFINAIVCCVAAVLATAYSWLLVDPCSQDKDPGVGAVQVTRYYFNRETKLCEKFVYFGSAGNRNNFASAEECRAKCPGLIIAKHCL